VVHENHLGLRVLDDVFDLTGAQAGVYGDHDQARRRDGEAAFEHRRRVRAEKGDPIALLEARVLETRGETVDSLLELRVGVAAVAVDDGLLVGEHIGAAFEEAQRGELRPVDFLAHGKIPSLS
jgi:hypothetical protein